MSPSPWRHTLNTLPLIQIYTSRKTSSCKEQKLSSFSTRLKLTAHHQSERAMFFMVWMLLVYSLVAALGCYQCCLAVSKAWFWLLEQIFNNLLQISLNVQIIKLRSYSLKLFQRRKFLKNLKFQKKWSLSLWKVFHNLENVFLCSIPPLGSFLFLSSRMLFFFFFKSE